MSEHRAALDALLATIRRCPTDAWIRPRAVGKWSPAETVEHLALVYRALLAELAGTSAVRRRAGPLVTFLLRWLFLPHVLFHRSFPIRATASNEARPRGFVPDPEDAARGFRELASRVEHELAALGDRRLPHPYFGSLDAATTLRFHAVHIEHHRRQIAAAAQPERLASAPRPTR